MFMLFTWKRFRIHFQSKVRHISLLNIDFILLHKSGQLDIWVVFRRLQLNLQGIRPSIQQCAAKYCSAVKQVSTHTHTHTRYLWRKVHSYQFPKYEILVRRALIFLKKYNTRGTGVISCFSNSFSCSEHMIWQWLVNTDKLMLTTTILFK